MAKLDSSLIKYVWRNSKRDQIFILFVILASMPTYFMSLDLPKRIVDGPIQSVGFDRPGDTRNFLETYLPLPEFLIGEPIKIFAGFELERVPFLFALSFAFLVLVIANGLFKMYINTFKGRSGERLLRRLRFVLFDRVLRYPMARFRRMKPSEISSMIKDEVEPMGEFIGNAFTEPLFLGGQALTGLLFIFLQNVYLGLMTAAIIAFQAWLIPLLRVRLVQLNRQRQIVARRLAGRIGEVVEGIPEIHVNDASNRERANISQLLGDIFFIRFELFQKKFEIKFYNNFLIQFLAFLFYAVGGYFAITGRLNVGQLLGVIVAYKDLPGPVKGLIDWDQKRTQVEVRYQQIIEQFTDEDARPSELQEPSSGVIEPLSSGFEVSNLAITDDAGSKLIERASAKIDVNERVAIVGQVNSGASEFAEALARLQDPSGGRITLGGHELSDLPESITGRRTAYVDANTFLPDTTIRENLVYALRNQPLTEKIREGDELAKYQLHMNEKKLADNSLFDLEAEWIDYARLGLSGEAELDGRIQKVLRMVVLHDEIRNLGLRGTISLDKRPELCKKLVEARGIFRERLDSYQIAEFVEPFDPERYNTQATVGENLLFGTAVDPSFSETNLPSNAYVIEALSSDRLYERLLDMGKELAVTTIELFGELSIDNPFFDQLDYMSADEIPEYRALLSRIANKDSAAIEADDRAMLIRLPFAYIEPHNRLGLLDEDLMAEILGARNRLQVSMSKAGGGQVAFYDPESYNPASSVIDNVLLGRIASGVAEGPDRVTAAIRDLLEEMGLVDDIYQIGLSFSVGTGGKRLSETQRQKLKLARALLKQPDILIVNRALNTLDSRTQKKVLDTIVEDASGAGERSYGIIWVPINPAFSKHFDRVLVFSDGNLVEDGSPDELIKSGEVYQSLLGTGASFTT